MSREATNDELRILCKKLFAGHEQVVISDWDEANDRTQELRIIDFHDGSKIAQIHDRVPNLESMGS